MCFARRSAFAVHNVKINHWQGAVVVATPGAVTLDQNAAAAKAHRLEYLMLVANLNLLKV